MGGRRQWGGATAPATAAEALGPPHPRSQLAHLTPSPPCGASGVPGISQGGRGAGGSRNRWQGRSLAMGGRPVGLGHCLCQHPARGRQLAWRIPVHSALPSAAQSLPGREQKEPEKSARAEFRCLESLHSNFGVACPGRSPRAWLALPTWEEGSGLVRTWKVPALHPQTVGYHQATAHAAVSGPGLAAPWHTEEAQAAELQHQTHVWAPPGLPLSPADSLPRPHHPHACPEVCPGGSEWVSADKGRKGRRERPAYGSRGDGHVAAFPPLGWSRGLACMEARSRAQAGVDEAPQKPLCSPSCCQVSGLCLPW
uniref:uncharacterized protein LOC118536989 n=1 Tax=Halichoerus grypus TaxID=9711 RepID=UPI0016599658|nr:uncharacterized protein LOC118536989 [Halichoerus grypus]